jgi:hypothetical protein
LIEDNGENGIEFHLPFHNYAGPGTHIETRIDKSMMPTDILDRAALIHDIEYEDPNITQFQADNNMWKNLVRKSFYMTPVANLTRLILLANSVLGIHKPEKDIDKYERLRRKARENGLQDNDMFYSHA